jgi:hypothetical protein
MKRWLLRMLSTTCEHCGRKKPRGTEYCDDCWRAFGARSYGVGDE